MRTIDFVRPTRVERIIQESSNIRTLVFEDETSLESKAGQFAMIWLPRFGEFPMSISLPFGGKQTSIAVKAMGEGSKHLYEAKVGDVIGVRGPYGNYFDLSKARNLLLVGGGTGTVPLLALAKEVSEKKKKASFVIGARTKNELPFLQAARRLLGKDNVYPSTDDGSLGFPGMAHEQVLALLEKRKFDQIFSCGPERMMREVYEIAARRKIPAQFSLERIMKCALGICGSCTIGEYVLCRDGPVLDSSQVGMLGREFGSMHRDKTGTLRPI